MPPDEVGFAQPARQRARDGLQRLVADDAAELPVELAEAVEVDHHQPRRLAVAVAAAELQTQVVLEQATVAQARERVVVGEAEQLLLELLAGRDVLELGDVVQRLALAVAHERHREDRRDGLAGGVEVALLDLVGGDLAVLQAAPLDVRR